MDISQIKVESSFFLSSPFPHCLTPSQAIKIYRRYNCGLVGAVPINQEKVTNFLKNRRKIKLQMYKLKTQNSSVWQWTADSLVKLPKPSRFLLFMAEACLLECRVTIDWHSYMFLL